jgi:hypothetical protein
MGETDLKIAPPKKGFSAPRKDVQGSNAEGSKLRNVMILVQIH